MFTGAGAWQDREYPSSDQKPDQPAPSVLESLQSQTTALARFAEPRWSFRLEMCWGLVKEVSQGGFLGDPKQALALFFHFC